MYFSQSVKGFGPDSCNKIQKNFEKSTNEEGEGEAFRFQQKATRAAGVCICPGDLLFDRRVVAPLPVPLYSFRWSESLESSVDVALLEQVFHKVIWNLLKMWIICFTL